MNGQPDSIGLPNRRLEPVAPGGLRACAPAKLNLHLRVGPRGPDGFHPLDSVVVKISLHDTLDVAVRDDGRITFACTGADCGPPESNLAFRAAKLLAPRRPAPAAGAHLALTKNIPPESGLGGGSSDAAAALIALNDLWKLGLSTTTLAELAARLGSDVPLFLGGPAARITGRGECVVPATVHAFTAVVFLPDVSCSTAEVYHAFDQDPPPPAKPLDPATIADQPPSQWRDRLRNDLARPARRICPGLAATWDQLRHALPIPVHLAGSGSALFVLCDDHAELQGVLAAVEPSLPVTCRIVGPTSW